MDLAVGTDLAGTDLAEAAVLGPAADLGPADSAYLGSADLARDLPVANASSACGHRRQCCIDVRAPLGGGGGEDAPQG